MPDNELKIPRVKDPLAGLPVSMDVEKDAATELGALAGSFKRKEAAENDRRRLATDSEFWFCVVFKSREQKNAFLAGAGLESYGDKYLDGEKVAVKMGIEIPKVSLQVQGEREDTGMTRNFKPIREGGE
jgi:hypothetical protein